jgi:hypothetical protein
MRVAPPTSTISSNCAGCSRASRIAHRPLQRRAHALQQRLGQLVEAVLVQRPVQRLAGHADLHRRLPGAGQRALGRFQAPPQLAVFVHAQRLRRDPVVGQEGLQQQFQEILAAEEVVAGAGVDLDHAFEHLQDRHVEGAAAQIQHQEAAMALAFLQAIGEGSRSGLVDQPFDADPGQFAGGAGGLALRVGEIRRHADHRFAHCFAERGFGIGQQRAQHHCRQFFRAEAMFAQHSLAVAAHPALESRHAALRVADQAFARGLADQDAAVVGADHRRGQQFAERIGKQAAALRGIDTDQGVRGAEVDTDNHCRAGPLRKRKGPVSVAAAPTGTPRTIIASAENRMQRAAAGVVPAWGESQAKKKPLANQRLLQTCLKREVITSSWLLRQRPWPCRRCRQQPWRCRQPCRQRHRSGQRR